MLSIVFVDVLGDLIACNPAENSMLSRDVSNGQGLEVWAYCDVTTLM